MVVEFKKQSVKSSINRGLALYQAFGQKDILQEIVGIIKNHN